MTKPKAIVFDVDGVILQTDFILQEIHQLGLKGEGKWDYFYGKCNCDEVKPINSMVDLYKSVRYSSNALTCIVCTARNENSRKETLLKLAECEILCDKIYMRGADDKREDTEVKRDLLKQIMEEYDIVAFIDDSLRNCEVAKDLGIMALRVV